MAVLNNLSNFIIEFTKIYTSVLITKNTITFIWLLNISLIWKDKKSLTIAIAIYFIGVLGEFYGILVYWFSIHQCSIIIIVERNLFLILTALIQL